MNNYRNNRKNRFKSSGDRNFRKRSLNGHKNQNEFNTHSEFRHRNPGRNNQNAGKLIDKYNNLAREALSTGDKILSEKFFWNIQKKQIWGRPKSPFKKFI